MSANIRVVVLGHPGCGGKGGVEIEQPFQDKGCREFLSRACMDIANQRLCKSRVQDWGLHWLNKSFSNAGAVEQHEGPVSRNSVP